MSHRWRVAIGLFAIALVVAAAVVGSRLFRADDDADEAEPTFVVDELDCLTGVYANTDFALEGDDGGNLTVCHYDQLPRDPSSPASHRLAYSTELSAEESAAVRTAVDSAPRGKLPFTDCEVGDDSPGEFFLVRTPTQVAFWVYNANCGDNGLLTVAPRGGVVRRHDTAGLLDALDTLYGPLGPETD